MVSALSVDKRDSALRLFQLRAERFQHFQLRLHPREDMEHEQRFVLKCSFSDISSCGAWVPLSVLCALRAFSPLVGSQFSV